MPKGHKRHWKRHLQQSATTWTSMVREERVRERIQKEAPDVVALLDYFAGQLRPYDSYGWTIFNDWLDACYNRRAITDHLPLGVSLLDPSRVRSIVFPDLRPASLRARA